MPEDYLSFDDALNELQMQEAELRELVSQGRLRAFRDENTLKFRRSDVDALRLQRETQPTAVVGPELDMEDDGLDLQPEEAPFAPGAEPVAEEPIDLLADEELDYDDTADTLIGGDLEDETSETELALSDLEPVEEGGSTKIPTIELTPTEQATGETAVPTLEIGEDIEAADTGADTEVPTMVLGLDEYDDTQVATEEVATEEVYIGEEEFEEVEPAIADIEEPYVPAEEEQEADAARRSVTGSSGYGTAAAARVRPSPLYTSMCAIAAVILLIPGGIFFYCLVNNQVPDWDIMKSVMTFFWDQFKISYPPGY